MTSLIFVKNDRLVGRPPLDIYVTAISHKPLMPTVVMTAVGMGDHFFL